MIDGLRPISAAVVAGHVPHRPRSASGFVQKKMKQKARFSGTKRDSNNLSNSLGWRK
jgi:hypothetical protein